MTRTNFGAGHLLARLPARKLLPWILPVALVLVATGVWYRASDSDRATATTAIAGVHAPVSLPARHPKVDAVDVMIERLKTRLENEPGDIEGWVLLGRSHHFLQQWDEAAAAFARARALGWSAESPPLDDKANTAASSDPMFDSVQALVQQQSQALRTPAQNPVAGSAQ